ncbi:putative transporter [Vibrio cholerae]|nr:putative transporter [Vibrio cholerae]
MTGIIGKEDLKMISWDVLWLVSGGIALGSRCGYPLFADGEFYVTHRDC